MRESTIKKKDMEDSAVLSRRTNIFSRRIGPKVGEFNRLVERIRPKLGGVAGEERENRMCQCSVKRFAENQNGIACR